MIVKVIVTFRSQKQYALKLGLAVYYSSQWSFSVATCLVALASSFSGHPATASKSQPSTIIVQLRQLGTGHIRTTHLPSLYKLLFLGLLALKKDNS